MIASSPAPEAIPQPVSRSGIEETGPSKDTERMNDRTNDVVALASTELTTPAKSTAKATTVIATAATQSHCVARVPRQMNTAPVRISASWASMRARIGPVNSTSSSIPKEPNAAKVATWGLPITSALKANAAGMTTAVRAARRVAASPRSRPRSH